jgi:hypothetical protein
MMGWDACSSGLGVASFGFKGWKGLACRLHEFHCSDLVLLVTGEVIAGIYLSSLVRRG